MSIWREFNENPCGRRVGDCAVRAVSVALDVSWGRAYAMLCAKGYTLCDLPNSDAVWSAVLREHGFSRHSVPDTCPDCFTASDFAEMYPHGVYVLGFGGHVATIRDGVLYDAWNSSNEVPQFYLSKGE